MAILINNFKTKLAKTIKLHFCLSTNNLQNEKDLQRTLTMWRSIFLSTYKLVSEPDFIASGSNQYYISNNIKTTSG